MKESYIKTKNDLSFVNCNDKFNKLNNNHLKSKFKFFRKEFPRLSQWNQHINQKSRLELKTTTM